MALVSDIQLQDGSVKPPKLDTTQKFTVAGLTATTALAVGETVPLSTTGLVTVKSANDITNWIQTTNTNGNVSLYLSNDARPDWALKVAGTASDSFIIANSYGANNTEQYPALSIGTAGAVGVGKTGAGSILDIAYANSTTGGIQITETTNSVGLKATSESSSASVGTTTNHKLGLRVNATTHAVLDTSGQLGIGTDSPGAKLDVRGSATFNEGGAAVDFRVEGDTETNLLFVDGSADRVGIGTATPASLLHVDDGDGGNTVACFNGTINASCYAGEKEGHIIQCNFNNFTQRGGLSFNIDNVGTVTDSAACDSTVVTINGANTCVCFFKCDGSNDDISLVGGSIGNALCNDTSPKLGGNLDVNNQCIINSNTDEGIRLVPNGAGRVIIDGLCWPAADGTAGYVLCTNGSGDLTWSPDGGSTWDVGSGVLFTNAGCKVGIGTSTPSDVLTVFSCAATTNWGLNVCDPHPACAYGAQIKVTGACTGFPALNVVQNSDPLFRVDTGGVVGIGTSALGSTCNVKLDIYSAGASTAMILRSGNTSAASSTILGEGYRANGDCEQVLQIYGRNKNGSIDLGILEISAETKYCTGAIELKTFDGSSMTTKMKITSGGCVGIGTANPAAAFHLNNGASITNLPASTRAVFSNGSGADAITRVGIYAGVASAFAVLDLGRNDAACRASITYDSSVDTLAFGTAGGAADVTINASGNVGIGTATPTVPLEVYTAYSSDVANNIALRGTAGSKGEMRISFRATNVGGVDRVYARIGACVSCEVNGGAEEGNLTFKTWNGTAGEVTNMFLQSGGNVGIGTATTFDSLHVHDGFVRVTGNPSASALSANGVGKIGGLTGNGFYAYGKGSTYDLALANANTTPALAIPTGGSATPVVYIPNKLGIGTTAPAYRFESSCSSQSTSYPLALRNPDNSTCLSGVGILGGLGRTADSTIQYFAMMTLVKEQAWTGTGSTIKGSLLFSTPCNESGVERMRITSAGNVGIGTAAPATNFHVNGSAHGVARISTAAAGCYAQLQLVNSCGCYWYQTIVDADCSLRFYNGSDRVTFTNSGDVGIGTAAPAGRLAVMGDAGTTQWAANICDLNTVCTYGLRAFGKGSKAGFPIFLVNHNSDELLRVDTGGNATFLCKVGIGTNGPLYPFDVRTSSNHRLFIRDSSTSAGSEIQIQAGNDADDATTNLKFSASQYFLENGSLGIGTASPSVKLHLEGSSTASALRLGETNSGADTYVGFLDTSGNFGVDVNGGGYFRIATGSAERLRIICGGYVGIGTTVPRYNLNVYGNNSTAVGIGIDNASGDATLDISALGGSYNAHGAAACEVWFYSPDNINIGGATGGSNDIKFLGAGAERVRITSGGKVGINTTTRGNVFYEGGHSAQLQVEGTTPTNSGISLIRNNAQYGPSLILARSCGTSVGSNTLVATGQSIGGINFQANDGTDFVQAAYIAAKVGNHAASNCMSGELQFATSDGTNGSVLERMRIAEDGMVGIGTTVPTTQLMVSGAENNCEVLRVANIQGAGGGTQGITYIGISPWSSATNAHTRIGAVEASDASYQAHMIFETRSTDADNLPSERMRITSAGRVGIGTTTPNPNLHVVGSIGSTTHMTAQGGIYFSVAPGAEFEPVRITTAASGGGTCTLYIGNEAIQTSSDRRVKNNIQCYTCSAVSVLDNARVVEFEYDKEKISDHSDFGPSSRGKYVGLIAQEMIEYARWAINDGEGDPEGEHIWKAEYQHMVPLLIKAVQELNERIEESQEEVTTLKSKVAALEAA